MKVIAYLKFLKSPKPMGVSIHRTGLLDWNTGLEYWTELFSFLDKFLCLFLERSLRFYNLATMDDHNNDIR